MSLKSCTEIYDRQSSINEKGETTYQRLFQVVTTNPKDGAYLARIAPGVAVGDQYATTTEFDTNAFCLGIQTRCTAEDGKTWETTVDYGPAPDAGQNPLNEPPEVSWSFAQFEREIDRDINGRAIANSAGDPFLNQLVRDDSRPILSVTRNEAFFNAQLAYWYRDVVNSDPFFGANPGQVKVSNISASRQFSDQIGFYWKVSYEFAFNAEGWRKKVLSMGLREKKNGKLQNILVNGTPITEPMLLGQNGEQLAQNGTPYALEFDVYNKAPFSVFGF
jgi:hypothetical protein